MIMLISGCNGSQKKTPIVLNNYCSLKTPLTLNEEVKKDLTKISPTLFKYIEVEETTRVCECPDSRTDKSKKECWKRYENIRNIKPSSTK